jgi:hypothetical protein
MDAEGYADLLPWLVFVVIERKTGLGLGWAGGCAAVAGVVLTASAYWRGRRAPVARLSVVLFSVLCFADFVVPSWSSHFADARSIATLVLGVVCLVSARTTPLSAAYTVAHVPPAVPTDARFERVNVAISCAWGIGAALVAIAFATSDLDHSAVALTFLNWVLPLAILTVTLIWTSRRWQRFCLELDADVHVGDALEAGAMPSELGAWVQGHDASVHPFPASRRRNA